MKLLKFRNGEWTKARKLRMSKDAFARIDTEKLKADVDGFMKDVKDFPKRDQRDFMIAGGTLVVELWNKSKNVGERLSAATILLGLLQTEKEALDLDGNLAKLRTGG